MEDEAERSESNRFALVVGAPIGRSHYREAVQASVARAACYFRREGFETRVVAGSDATCEGIRRGLVWLKNHARRMGDVAAFYYAGHGYLIEDVEGHERSGERAPAFHQMIVPVDFRESKPGDFRVILGIELGRALGAIAGATDNVTVILDCCYAAEAVRDSCELSDDQIATLSRRLGEQVCRSKFERFFPAEGSSFGQHGIAMLLASTTVERSYPARFDDGSWALLFSDTLLDVLELPVARGWSWESILALTRTRIWGRHPEQRPDVAGERYRTPFSRTISRLPIGTFFAVRSGHRAELPYASFLIVQEGDEFELLDVESGSSIGTAHCRRADARGVFIELSPGTPCETPEYMHARGPSLDRASRWSRLAKHVASNRVDARGPGHYVRWGLVTKYGQRELAASESAELRELDRLYISVRNTSRSKIWHSTILHIDHELNIRHWSFGDASGVVVTPSATRVLTAGPHEGCRGVELRCDDENSSGPWECRLLVVLADGPFTVQTLEGKTTTDDMPVDFGPSQASELRIVEFRYRLNQARTRSTRRFSMKSNESMLYPLLSDPRTGRPLLGVPLSALEHQRVLVPQPAPGRVPTLQSDNLSVNNIGQGWGVLFPDSELGRQMRDAIQELVEHRAAQLAEAPIPLQVREWAVPEDMSIGSFVSEYNKIRRFERPYYLLILGDLWQIPASYDRALSDRALVGRLCLPTITDYTTYARKLVSAENQRRTRSSRLAPRVVVFSAHEPGGRDRALELGQSMWVEPLLEHLRSPSPDGRVPDVLSCFAAAPTVKGWSRTRQLLKHEELSVLVSLSHGAGNPTWSQEEKEALQGTMSIRGELGLVDSIAEEPFVPNGAWFYYACFGAGTPVSSQVAGSLRRLGGESSGVLRTLAHERPFIARMPQIALANPHGPLGVYAHVDLVFTYAFAEHAKQRADGDGEYRSAPTAINTLVEEVCRGSRFGAARRRLLEPMFAASANVHNTSLKAREQADRLTCTLLDGGDEYLDTAVRYTVRRAVSALLDRYPRELVTLEKIAEQAGLAVSALAPPDDVMSAYFHHNTLAYYDLRSWVLLGDPAARLPVRKNQLPAKVDPREFFGSAIEVRSEEPVRGADSLTTQRNLEDTGVLDTSLPKLVEPWDALTVPKFGTRRLYDAIQEYNFARRSNTRSRAVAEKFGIPYELLAEWSEYAETLLRSAIEKAHERS